MSKSRGNLVRPGDYFDSFGADALRLYHLFMAPPGDEVDWNAQGVPGAARFLDRLWRLADPESGAVPVAAGDTALHVEREAHRLIDRVSDEYRRWSFNTSVAAFMEFTNFLYKAGKTPFAVDTLLLLLAPMTPHVTAELWARRHDGAHVHEQAWPEADPAMLVRETVTMVVQVNGKVRDRLDVPPDIDPAEMERLALASSRVREHTGGSAPRKIVCRPPGLVNLVV